MPEPTSVYATDKYIYNYFVNPLASKLCFLEPNYITILAILLTIPVMYGLLNNWSTQTMVLLIIFRAYLDCLDGAIARKCNKFSEFGAKLDYQGDNLFSSLYVISMIYLLYNKSDTKKYIGLIVIVLLILFKNIEKYDYIYADNTILASGLIMYIFNIFNNSII